jgi:peptidase M10/serralysin-like protein
MTNYLGQWDPNKVYFGEMQDDDTPHPGGADVVSYMGATWICNYYTVGMPPIFDEAGDTGMWRLAPGSPAPNYNPVAPEAPTHLEAGYTDSNTIALFWDASEVHGVGEVTHYNIYDNGVKIGTSIDEGFTAHGLQTGSTHSFSVEAVDVTGVSVDSSLLTVQTDDEQIMSGKHYSGYVDMGLPGYDIVEMSRESGLRNFTLAFMQATNASLDSTGHLIDDADFGIGWGGLDKINISEGRLVEEVRQIEAEGGDVTISFGGYTNRDVAVIAHEYMDDLKGPPHNMTAAQAEKATVTKLTALLQSVVSTYGVNHLDFDVEKDTWHEGHVYNTVDDLVANSLRNQALVALQKANPDLHVSFTVPTLPGGLTGPGGESGDVMGLIADAAAAGVRFDTVNIMAMDYGDHSAGTMGEKAIQAAINVHEQLLDMGLDNVKVGITPMIGQNDVLDEVFTLEDARLVEAFAVRTSWVSGIGIWELPRDVAQAADNLGTVSSYYSGVAQDAYEFSGIFDDVEVRSTSGADTVEGDELDDHLYGLGGNDVMRGFDGVDTLDGGLANDALYGGKGADALVGGDGKDTFVFDKAKESAFGAADRIYDLSNKDKVSLRLIDADTTTAGNQNFHMGGDHFTHSKGELIRFYDSATKTTWFQGDTDGDGDADLAIAVRGDHHTFDHFQL